MPDAATDSSFFLEKIEKAIGERATEKSRHEPHLANILPFLQ
jgi:hypothetical protein